MTNTLEQIPATRRCGDCGYDLSGLPEAGRCPECGGSFSPDEAVLWGWAAGSMAGAWNRRPGKVVEKGGWRNKLLLLTNVVVLLIVAAQVQPGNRVIAGVLVAGVSAAWWYTRRGTPRRTAAANVQVRLCARGFGQRDGPGPVQLEKWQRDSLFHIQKMPDGWGRFCVMRSRQEWVPWSVDAEVFLSEPQAVALRELMMRWIENADEAD